MSSVQKEKKSLISKGLCVLLLDVFVRCFQSMLLIDMFFSSVT